MNIMYKRFIAFYIDALVSGFTILLPLLIIYVIHNNIQLNVFHVRLISVCAVILLLIKDISGKSIGKRIMHIKIVENKHKTTKPKWQYLLVRNITLCIWPVDVIRILYGKERLLDNKFGLTVIKE